MLPPEAFAKPGVRIDQVVPVQAVLEFQLGFEHQSYFAFLLLCALEEPELEY